MAAGRDGEDTTAAASTEKSKPSSSRIAFPNQEHLLVSVRMAIAPAARSWAGQSSGPN